MIVTSRWGEVTKVPHLSKLLYFLKISTPFFRLPLIIDRDTLIALGQTI
jgi:hypothetical protein